MANAQSKSLFLMLLALGIPIAYADEHSYGFHETHSQMIENMYHSGMVNLEKSTISNIVEVNGFIRAKNTTINILNVNGDADLDHVIIQGPVSIQGKLTTDDSHFQDNVMVKGQINAEDTHFKKNITIYGNHSEFENCHLADIMIKTNTTSNPQHVYFEETQVSGDIIFKSPGIVHLDKASKISGNVIGGSMEIS